MPRTGWTPSLVDVLRPMLKRIEGDNAGRIVELAGHQVGDNGFEVGPLDLGLAVNGAQAAKAVDDEIDGLIRAEGPAATSKALPSLSTSEIWSRATPVLTISSRCGWCKPKPHVLGSTVLRSDPIAGPEGAGQAPRRRALHHQDAQGRTRRRRMAGRNGGAVAGRGTRRTDDVCADWRNASLNRHVERIFGINDGSAGSGRLGTTESLRASGFASARSVR
jgi:hypothetical protein